MQVRVHDLIDGGVKLADDLAGYLRSVHLRLSNSVHAETRVYTCRAWRTRTAAPFELHWNDDEVPGEQLLGSYGFGPAPLAEVIAELGRGGAVRLFIFNSDADLCFQEVLVAA